MTTRAQIPEAELGPELAVLERVIDGLQRAWIDADDEVVEVARRRVERLMEGCGPTAREQCEALLGRLERVRLQAGLRKQPRH